MRTFLLSVLGLTTLIATAACSGTVNPSQSPSEQGNDPSKSEVASSALSRNQSPSVPASDTETLVSGNTELAVDLYKTLGSDVRFAGKNLFFSPHSISVALAMTYAGAHGNTESEMATALHFTLPQAQLHNAINGLDLALASRGASGAKAKDGTPFRLRISNSLWGLPKMPFEQPFLDTIATNYGAGIRLTDFIQNPEGSRTAINGWVETETEQRVKDLIPAGVINALTRLVLVNAVYFNASWATPFEPVLTKPGVFHAADGAAMTDFMHQTTELGHAHGDGYDAVRIPYDGNELDMLAIVPDDLGAFESTLTASKLNTIASSMKSGLVQLTLPKFKVEGETFSVAGTLQQLGMKDAFKDGAADFSNMLPLNVDRLYVSDVMHKAFVAVDETGTEAAAATAVVMAGRGATGPDDKTVITVDKPFVFAIQDRATGAFVFVGRVMHP